MTTDTAIAPTPAGYLRSRGYHIYIVASMGIVALMDQYLSSVESTAIPYFPVYIK